MYNLISRSIKQCRNNPTSKAPSPIRATTTLKNTIHIIMIFFLLFALILLPNLLLAQEYNNSSVVRIVIVYAQKCEDCDLILKKYLPQIFLQYEKHVQVISIDSTLPVNQELLSELGENYKLSWKKVNFPVILIDKDILIGKTQIEKRLRITLDYYLSQGGTNFLLPGLQPRKASFVNILLIICFILLVILIVLSSIMLRFTRNRFLTEKLKLKKILISQNHIDQTLLILIGRTGSSIDFLNEIVQILYRQQNQNLSGNTSAALSLIEKLLSTIQKQVGILFLEKYNSKVAFNPNRHTTYEKLIPGEEVIVVEVGWKLGSSILKKALVKKAK